MIVIVIIYHFQLNYVILLYNFILFIFFYSFILKFKIEEKNINNFDYYFVVVFVVALLQYSKFNNEKSKRFSFYFAFRN
jgi:hypothetical protein